MAGAAAAQIPASRGRVAAAARPCGRRARSARSRPEADRHGGGPRQSPAQADSLVEALLKLQGYVPVDADADSADYRSADRTLRLRGDSRVEREGRVITAEDSIVYMDRATWGGLRQAAGQPAAGEGHPSAATSLYDMASGAPTCAARDQDHRDATWFVAGDVTDERGQRIYAQNSTFTSDDRPDPAYHFKADRIMIIRNRILVGRPATCTSRTCR